MINLQTINFELSRAALMAQFRRDVSGLTCAAQPVYGSPDYWIWQTYVNGNTLQVEPSAFDLRSIQLAERYKTVIEGMPE